MIRAQFLAHFNLSIFAFYRINLRSMGENRGISRAGESLLLRISEET